MISWNFYLNEEGKIPSFVLTCVSMSPIFIRSLFFVLVGSLVFYFNFAFAKALCHTIYTPKNKTLEKTPIFVSLILLLFASSILLIFRAVHNKNTYRKID